MQEASGSVADGLTGMMNVFVDPTTTAKKVPSKLSWLWPVLLLVIGSAIISYLMTPYNIQLSDAALAQRNVPPEQMESARKINQTIFSFTPILAPLFAIGFTALFALLVKVVYAAMDIRPKYRDLFSLMAACGLIQMLQVIAGYFVIRAKGDQIVSPEQLQPPFGLDIFFPSLHGVPWAFLNFFSIFEIWYLVVLVFGLASLTRSSVTKAVIASSPVWLIPLAFKMIGATFTKTPS